MKALYKSSIVFSLVLLLSIFVVFAAALTSSSVDPSNVDEDVSYLFNFTINNSDSAATNITQLNITLPTGFSFTSFDTNGSSAGPQNFSNASSTVVSWDNTSVDGFIVNQTTEYFWFNATGATPGTYNFTVTVSDLVSGVNSTNVSVTVNDTTIPALTAVSTPTVGNTNSTILINYTATDNIGVTDFNISVNDTGTMTDYIMTNNGNDYTFTINITASSTLPYYYNVTFRDAAGNVNATDEVTVTVTDNQPPTFNETLANQTVESGAQFYYDVNASDNIAISVYLVNNSDSGNFTINAASGLIENGTILAVGTYAVNISVNDTAGNMQSGFINVTVGDTTAPTASSGSPTGTITDTTPELNITSNENATCKFSVDVEYNFTTMNFTYSGTALAHNYTLTTALSGSGTPHTIYTRCNDTAGNVATTSYSYSFTVGTAASGGGGSSGGSSISVPSGTDLTQGKTLNLVRGDKVSITLKGSSHSIEVESVNSVLRKVTLIIRSHPISVTLEEGEIKFVDVDHDGVADLRVNLKEIGLSGIVLEIKEVTESMTSEDVVEPVKEATDVMEEKPKEGEVMEEKDVEPVEPTQFRMTRGMWIGVVVVIFILAWFLLRNKGNRR